MRNIAQLIIWLSDNGYEATFGEAHRPEWVAKEYAKQGKGSANSLHIQRLALDIMLFKDGNYLTSSEEYKRVGAAWKVIHPDNRWGGDITSRPDGNHFSMIDTEGSRRI
jgi:hypothetical protein